MRKHIIGLGVALFFALGGEATADQLNINAQTGTSYTFLNTDCSKLVTFNNSGAVAVTLPQASSASGGGAGAGTFMPPCDIKVINKGTGTVTITPTVSTIAGASTLVLTTAQGAEITSDGTNYQSAGSVGSSTPAFASIAGTAAPFPITGLAAAQGGAVSVTGGTSATSADAGGAVQLVGGAPGATGAGGAVQLTGGTGGATSGTGGAITIASGPAGATTGVGGAVTITAGAGTAGTGAGVTITAAAGAGGTAAGGNVNIVPGAAVSTGIPGNVQFNGNANLIYATYFFTGTPAATNQLFFLATRPLQVISCAEIHTTAAGSTSTLTVEKDTGTTAPGSGTSVFQSGSFNLNATANTVQNATISTTVATASMNAGDRLGVVFADAIQSSAGVVVTCGLAPL